MAIYDEVIMKKLQILLFVLVLIFLLSFTPLANVKNVSINGELNNKHSIAKMLKGKNFFWTSAKAMSELIEVDKMYDTAKVSKTITMDVEIELVERAAFIAIKSGAYYVVIDAYGVVLSLSETADAPYVIEGFTVTSAVLGEALVADEMQLIERAVQIVYMYQSHTDYLPKVSLVDGEIIQDMGDIKVNYGMASDVELQFNRALVIYEHLIENGATSGIINVTDPEKPFVEPIKR